MKGVPVWMWVTAIVLSVVFVLSVVTVSQTIFNVSTRSVSWGGLSYKCNDDNSPLTDEQEFVGCRLCAMEDLSFNNVNDFNDLEGVLKFGDGDCVAKTTSRGRVKFVWDGVNPSSSKSGLHDFYVNDDFLGYVDAVRSKFVSWSLEYGYCPTKGLIKDEGLGACTEEVIVVEPDPIVDVDEPVPIADVPIIGEVIDDDFSVPLWIYLVIGLLALSVILFLLAGKKKGR